MGSWLNNFNVQSQSAGASWLFVKPPHLDTIGLKGKTLRKKIRSRREEDFISANPLGPGLSVKRIVQKFAPQNAYRYLLPLENERARSQKKRQKKGSCKFLQEPEIYNLNESFILETEVIIRANNNVVQNWSIQ